MLKIAKRIVLVLIVVVVLFAAGFVGWAATPLGPGQVALAALQPDEVVTVETVQGWTVFRPTGREAAAGFIFYPGGRVDYRSYAPALRQVAEAGYLVVLVPMPLSMAFFAPDRADPVPAAFPEVQRWAIGGHSLGGAMAARYCYSYPGRMEGLVLWASYPAASDSLADQDLKVLSIYGSEDGGVERIEASPPLLPQTTTWVRMEGGSHAQFGDYGLQPGDGQARISPQAQWEEAAFATVELLETIGR